MFINPPYSNIKAWIKKAYQESRKGATVVALIPARTDTRWFHEYVLGKAEIRFIRGRLKFGNAKYGAPFPSMLTIYRREPGRLCRGCRREGLICKNGDCWAEIARVIQENKDKEPERVEHEQLSLF